MKNRKILRILGLALIFSLFMAVVPAAPALAYDYDITLSSAQGMIGATITITGSDFAPSTINTDKWYRIIFSPTSASVGQYIDTSVLTYEVVREFDTDYDGEFSTTFTVPSACTDGNPDADVAPGTYYVYIVDVNTIRVKTTFTVTQGATLDALSPASGPPGASVMVSGYNFPASTALVFKFDTTIIIPASGHITTLGGGVFISTITIPATATAGVHTITVTAGTSTAYKTFTVTASPSLSPLVPVSGPAGTDVTITGAAFPASTALTFMLDSVAITPKAGSLVSSSTGIFVSVITIPLTATEGAHIISVTAGSITLTATFTVTGSGTTTTPPPTETTTPPPTETTTPPGSTTTSIKIPKPTDTVGASIALIGFDFTPGKTVTFTYDGEVVATETADPDGFVTTTFIVPPSMHGNHTIIATDGINSDTVAFTVESIAPEIPIPLVPGMGESIKPPVFFDWEDVIDDSVPVTYNLQIATDDSFAADTILIQKTGLDKSEYTLVEAEALRLSSTGTTYYWREKAVDAAMNESDWTGAGEFTITAPFKFTGWPLYLTIGIGAVLVFLLGLWAGRRTAFNY